MKRRLKKEEMTTRGSNLSFTPSEGGSAYNAYVRIETPHKEIIWFDNTNIKQTKKLHRWLSRIIEANK